MITQLDAMIRRVLGDIVPDVDVTTLDPTTDIRDAADMDSVDFLNFVSALYDETGVDIPERHYPEVRTIEGCERYLTARLPA
jgi:acyl carrier protein